MQHTATAVSSAKLLISLLLLTAAVAAAASAAAAASTCGYAACNAVQQDKYNVHIVAHTHDDVGWLRTVDQYYYYEVQFILDTVVDELMKDRNKKFTYVEIAYFFRWWREQDQAKRMQVNHLVQSGQLQFALGGWCMDDEATTHYVDIIDQHTDGLRFLNDTFGDCGRPRVAWQVDPFGHSKEHTALLAQMGFDGFYYGRIDYQDKAKRFKDRTMEMIWKGSSDIGSPKADLFAGTLYDNYCPPPGFWYDSGDEPVQDDPNLMDYNVERKVQDFVKVVTERRKIFSSNHLMLTMGCDFQYQGARRGFKSLDKLIKAVNAQSDKHNITAYYSTPSCYTKAVNSDNLKWSVKTDDFFPYAHIPHGFWTGYFTSRAALKRYVRQSSNLFQVIKQLAAVSGVQRKFSDTASRIDLLKQAMGVVQHHDGVSGTEKQVVAYDYAQRIARGVNTALPVLQRSWQNLTADAAYNSLQLCQLMNISSCPFTDVHDSFFIQVYNPISHSVWQVVRIPVKGKYYIVQDYQKRPVTSQTIPISEGTRRVPERGGAKSQFELVFNVTSIPAMGFVVYRIVPASAGDHGASTFTPIVREYWRNVRSSTGRSRRQSGTQGHVVAMEMLTEAQPVEAPDTAVIGDGPLIDMAYYFGFQGNNSQPQFTASGAYLFRPTKQVPEQFQPQWTGRVVGPVVNESHTSWSNWTFQVRRSFPNVADPLAYEENELTVGPIPFADRIGREVIVRYSTPIKNSGEFFTDANGRQMLRRLRDYRPTWKLQQTEPVAGNYYPINSAVYLNDSSTRFVVLTDRSEGGGSIKDGQLEVMVHRITINDDNLGVAEPLQEKGSDGKGMVVKASHWIFSESAASGARRRRELASRRFREPIVSFLADSPKLLTWSALRRPLPDSLQVISLEDWRDTDVKLLRLEHIYQANEDSQRSQPVTVDLSNLFTKFNILSVTELTLAANQEAAAAKRLQWRDGSEGDGLGDGWAKLLGTQVKMGPMQIRTFAVRVQYI